MNTPTPNNILQEAIISCLSGIRIFADLDTAELNIISAHMHVSRLEAGDVVFSEGDPGDKMYFIVDGTLDVLSIFDGQSEKSEKRIAVQAPGGSIGEMAVIGGFTRTATVKASSNATLLTLSGRRLKQICAEHPKIGVKILMAIAQLLSNHLRDTSQELLEFMSLREPDAPQI